VIDLPSPVVIIPSGSSSVRVVLPQVVGVTAGLEYVESRRVPVVQVLTTGVPVTVQCDSPEEMQKLAGELGDLVSEWALYASMGPIMWGQLMGSGDASSEG
jgi:hypothetical protein